MKSRIFVDSAILYAAGGRGGNGCVSFRREKFVPKGGPDGGDGGNGGNVILRADPQMDSLVSIYYQPHRVAESGTHGKGKLMHGRNGRNLVVRVPCGTQVRNESGELEADLVEPGQEYIAARGGQGGKGNRHWLTSTNRAPMENTPGEEGQTVTLRLELKLIADVGLVGYPNAGKSSLLRALTGAKPKVAAYPFTTLHPIIGTITFDDYTSLTIADLPGLISGASRGVGLGHAFLRHIERSRILAYVIDIAGTDGRKPWEDYLSLREEIEKYDASLLERKSIVIANKMDLPAGQSNLPIFVKKTGLRTVEISAETGKGIVSLKKILHKEASSLPSRNLDVRR